MAIFGSTMNGLACKGSDMDLTLLHTDYIVHNQHKQQILPKVIVKQQQQQQQQKIKQSAATSMQQHENSGTNSSDSNIDEENQQVTAELDESVDLLDMDDDLAATTTTVNDDGQQTGELNVYKQSLRKFFVRLHLRLRFLKLLYTKL
jgi:hypothetical protein